MSPFSKPAILPPHPPLKAEKQRLHYLSDAGTGGARGATDPPIFGRSVNPIPTGAGHIIPTHYYWHPQICSPSGITVPIT